MRTIAHISDLHFGRIDPPVAEGLVEDLANQPAPTLLVASGDFTQRARSQQYKDAAEFLKRLPTPLMVVPGNHDVPLWNVVRRALFPLTRYRRYISRDMFPEWHDKELCVLGVNSARSFTRTSGWLDAKQLDRIRQWSSGEAAGAFKVLVTHHPFIPPPDRPESDILRRGSSVLGALEGCGLDMLLAGHLHLSYHDDVRSHHAAAARSILSIQAGTATSTRRRGQPNAYNRITIHPDEVTVAVRSWTGRQFDETSVTRYQRSENQWRRAGADART